MITSTTSLIIRAQKKLHEEDSFDKSYCESVMAAKSTLMTVATHSSLSRKIINFNPRNAILGPDLVYGRTWG